jgi:hypothetical protein
MLNDGLLPSPLAIDLSIEPSLSFPRLPHHLTTIPARDPNELFNTPYELITTDAFMRLAHKYTIKEIYERFHAVQPDLVRKQLQITNRFNYVTRMAAQDSGRDASEIRAQIEEARNSGDTAMNEAAEVQVDEVDPSAEDRKVTVAPSIRSSSALAPK